MRVVIATFRNLVEKAPDANLAALLNAKTPAYLTQLQQSRRWGDEDIRTDVDYLADELKEAKRKLTYVESATAADGAGLTTNTSLSSSRANCHGRHPTRTAISGVRTLASSTTKIRSSSSACNRAGIPNLG